MFINSTNLFIGEAVVVFIVAFFMFTVLRQLFFFGFAPFSSLRPEVIDKILDQVEIRDDYTVFSLGYGRSGFLSAVEKKYPKVRLIGVEDSLYHCLIAKLQIFLRRSRIEIINSDFYKVDLRKADIIYCYLDVGILRDIHRKLKLEPRANSVIISSGFIIPYLQVMKIIKTEPKKRWYNFFIGTHEKVLTEKEKEYKPDDNIYFYEV